MFLRQQNFEIIVSFMIYIESYDLTIVAQDLLNEFIKNQGNFNFTLSLFQDASFQMSYFSGN